MKTATAATASVGLPQHRGRAPHRTLVRPSREFELCGIGVYSALMFVLVPIALLDLACAGTTLRGQITTLPGGPGVGETRTDPRIQEEGCVLDATVDVTQCGSDCMDREFPLRVFDRSSGLIVAEAPIKIHRELRENAEIVIPFSRTAELEFGHPLELYLFAPGASSKYLDVVSTSLPSTCVNRRVVWKEVMYKEDDEALTVSATLVVRNPRGNLPSNVIEPTEAKARLLVMGERTEILGVSDGAMMVPMVSDGRWNISLRLPWTELARLDPSRVLLVLPVLDMDNLSNDPSASPFLRYHGNVTIQTWAGGPPDRQIALHRAEADRLSEEIEAIDARLRALGGR